MPSASPKYLLAIDQGTTSSRAILYDAEAAPLGLAQRPTTQLYPQPGWVNQDAGEIWRTTIDCCHEVITQTGIAPEQIAAIGVTNQRETAILWDARTGMPVAPAIVWQSRQSTPQVDGIAGRAMATEYQAITGLVPDAYFSATKIAWLFEHQPELRKRAEAGEIRFGTVDSWLMWNLSRGQVHITDASNASRTLLFDIRTREWSDSLLADLNIPKQILPSVVGNCGHLFETDASLLGASIPVSGSAGDQQAALFGQACFAAGEVKNTYGTGSFLLMNTGPEAMNSRHQLLTTIAWSISDRVTYALEGSIFVTGAAVQWLRDGLGMIKTSGEIEALAASVPDTGGVAFVPALTGLGAPYWDARARGAIIGLTRGTTAGHIARATLEAIAFLTCDVLDAMMLDAQVPIHTLKVDGGAAANDVLLQIQADLLGIAVVRPKNLETTAIGAAFLAGLGSGFWRDQRDVAHRWHGDREFEPSISQDERKSRRHLWRRAVERSRDWAID